MIAAKQLPSLRNLEVIREDCVDTIDRLNWLEMLLVNDSKIWITHKVIHNAQLWSNTYSPSGRLLGFNIWAYVYKLCGIGCHKV